MGKKRNEYTNEYTKEYKIEAVRLIVEEGRPVSEVSHELGIAQSALHRGNTASFWQEVRAENLGQDEVPIYWPAWPKLKGQDELPLY